MASDWIKNSSKHLVILNAFHKYSSASVIFGVHSQHSTFKAINFSISQLWNCLRISLKIQQPLLDTSRGQTFPMITSFKKDMFDSIHFNKYYP